MKVILLRDVARIGKRYEIKEVPSGHALNFLIPRKLAEPATSENIKRLQAHKEKHAASMALDAANFEEALTKLKDTTVRIPVDANDQGHLFRGVRAEDIAHALAAEGLTVDSHQIDLAQPIKSIGTHEVGLHSGSAKGTFTIEVTSR